LVVLPPVEPEQDSDRVRIRTNEDNHPPWPPGPHLRPGGSRWGCVTRTA
jgi:hypothetical protein